MPRQVPSLIGVHVTSEWIAAYQSRRDRAVACVIPRSTPGGDELTELEAHTLQRVLARQGFDSNRIALVAPGGSTLASPIPAPPRSSGAPVDQIVAAEAARTLKCEPSEVELAIWSLPSSPRAKDGDASEYLVVALSHKAAESVIAPLENAGLEVVSIVAPADAVPRCLLHEQTAVIQIDLEAATLYVSSARQPLYQRRIPECGEARMIDAIVKQQRVDPALAARILQLGADADAERLKLDAIRDSQQHLRAAADALAAEMMDSLRYISHRFGNTPISSVLLAGKSATRSGLAEWMEAATGLPVAPVLWSDLGVVAPADPPPACQLLCAAAATRRADLTSDLTADLQREAGE